MIYALLTYVVFLAVYDHWGTAAVSWQVVYFACQYAFAGAVALISAKGKNKLIYLAIGVIFAVLTVLELSYLTATPEDYALAWSSTPVYMFTILIISIFVCYEIYIKWKKLSN